MNHMIIIAKLIAPVTCCIQVFYKQLLGIRSIQPPGFTRVQGKGGDKKEIWTPF